MIKAYIYYKDTGKFAYEYIGLPEYIMADLEGSDKDFTLEPIPHNLDIQYYWSGLEWEAVAPIESPLEERQADAWEGIKAERLKQTTSGVYVPSVDKVFHTDDVSVIQYNNIGNMIALGIFEPIQWKVMDNSWITMTEEVFKDLQIAMVQNTNRIYQVAEVHKAKMMEMDNPEDYDYSEGWDVAEPSN